MCIFCLMVHGLMDFSPSMAEKLLKQPDKNWIKPFSYNANDAFLLNNTMQCNAKERNATQYYTILYYTLLYKY